MDTASDLRLHRAERRIELLDRLVEERNRDLAITQEQASAVQADSGRPSHGSSGCCPSRATHSSCATTTAPSTNHTNIET